MDLLTKTRCASHTAHTKTDTVSQALRVTETNPQTDPQWECFVEEHPNGSIYHHPAWLQALEREHGQKGIYLKSVDSNGRVLAILPMHYTRGLPFNLGGELTGRRLSSLPRTPVAGPLSIDPQATVALLQEAVRRASQEPETRLQIKTQGPELDGLVEGVVCQPWRLSYVLKLTPSNHRYSIKKAVNKAQRLGLYVRPAETEADLREWYILHLGTMRRNAVPARPYRFFANLWENLRPQGLMELLLAEHQKDGRKRILAGTIFLRLGRTVSCAFNGSRFADISLRPNDIMYWEAINDAYRRGFEFFDFGEVAEGNSDLARYKTKWGATPVRLYRYYYPDLPAPKSAKVDSHYSVGSISQKIWKYVPLKLTEWMGDQVYRRL
jgi:CelD/BcsL family acetyltransferase involved in cellulose biosynthesis